MNNTTKPRRPGVRCTTSALVCTSCTRGVQENCAICLVVLQTAEIVTHRKCIAKHMINPGIAAVWSATKQIAPFSCTPRVQEVYTKAEVVHHSPGLLGLGVLFNCHA